MGFWHDPVSIQIGSVGYDTCVLYMSHIQANPIPALPYERETILFTLKEKLKLGSYDVPTKDFLNYIFY